jgi:hypothetical protein
MPPTGKPTGLSGAFLLGVALPRGSSMVAGVSPGPVGMDLAEVRGFALELMAEFGLVARGWDFGLNRVKGTVSRRASRTSSRRHTFPKGAKGATG